MTAKPRSGLCMERALGGRFRSDRGLPAPAWKS